MQGSAGLVLNSDFRGLAVRPSADRALGRQAAVRDDVPDPSEINPLWRNGMQNSTRFLSMFATSIFVSIGFLAFASPVRAQVVFQPGFHQALHVSVSTSSRTTYRTKIPIGRGGSRLRISFKAGDGSLTLHSATVALAGTQGKLASAPVAVSLNGSPGLTS